MKNTKLKIKHNFVTTSVQKYCKHLLNKKTLKHKHT